LCEEGPLRQRRRAVARVVEEDHSVSTTDPPKQRRVIAASAAPDEVIDAVRANVDAGGLELLAIAAYLALGKERA
jgi:hypothetical protein